MARVWFYNIPFHGHVNPTLPLIREMVARGDQVTYFSTASFEARIQATGALYRGYGSSYSFEQTRTVAHVIHLGNQVAEATYALLPEVAAADFPMSEQEVAGMREGLAEHVMNISNIEREAIELVQAAMT